MYTIRGGLINVVVNRAYTIIDYYIHNDIHKQYEFQKQTVFDDKSLTKDEKTEAIKLLNKAYDYNKILYNEGTKKTCENCGEECIATLYCEYCVRHYLISNFSNWTSGNNDIDNLIKKCQMETLHPEMVIEWIPYNNMRNIKYLAKGGFSEIYTANRIDGRYHEWDFKEKQLKRFETEHVVLKKLVNVESANQRWFEEAKSHFTICNKWAGVVRCYGLTQDPINGNYILVMMKKDMDLGKYLQQNHNQLTWKEKIKIIFEIIDSLYSIHTENAIHRDLHSGNILYSRYHNTWCISDLGFCGPADKKYTSVYGNLPYIAPEVITGKEYTFASDIYSIAILMWEISSGQPPFINHEYNYELAMKIVNGMRPKIASDIPSEYKSLIERCWNADPLQRPDIDTLLNEISNLHLFYQNVSNESFQLGINKTSRLEPIYPSSTSKLYQFENLPEPRNATEEEQEAFHSKSYDFNIPYNICDFGKSNNQNNIISKICNIIKDIQNDYKKETIRQQINSQEIDIDDGIIYDNSNLHPEEQDELEIPVFLFVYSNVNFFRRVLNWVYFILDSFINEDEIYNDSNFHSEEQDELELPDAKVFLFIYLFFTNMNFLCGF